MRIPLSLLVLAAPLTAQLPQGWYAFGTFGSATSTQIKGIFLAHPRSAGPATPVTGLLGDLTLTGSACILYRASDDTLLVGERAPLNSSIDVHVLRLNGSAVVSDASFSCGVGNRVGEIPQMGLLPDGRVVVVATDVLDGPLKNYLTTSYGWQGLGIVDTTSGLVTSVPISNGSSIVDVFNALAVAPDGQSVYIGTYVTNNSGDVYRVSVPAGGPATLVANIPAGISNLAFDTDGFLWVTEAYTTQGLFRLDVSNGQFTQIPHSSNALNGIAYEPVTGNFAVITGGAGTPNRSVFWLESANGADHVLDSPINIATPSGVTLRDNPARFGRGTPAASRYDWALSPNAGGLPLVGNAGFSMTVAAIGPNPPVIAIWAMSAGRLSTPIAALGVEIWIDFTRPHLIGVESAGLSITIPMPIPADASLTGVTLFAQSFQLEASNAFGATPGAQFTLL